MILFTCEYIHTFITYFFNNGTLILERREYNTLAVATAKNVFILLKIW